MYLVRVRCIFSRSNVTKIPVLEVTQGVFRSPCCCFIAQRNVSSRAKARFKISDNEVENEKITNGPVILGSELNEGFTLYHKQTSSVFHVKKDFLDANTKQTSDILKQFPKWLTPDKLEKIQNALDKDRNEESPAHNIQSIEDHSWHEQKLDISKLLQHYLMLSKIRLTGLVVLTSMAGFAMAPGPFEPVTFLCVSLGTALTSASANATNQFLEVPYDSQMNRTKNRVLVRGYLTPAHAVSFAGACGVLGLVILNYGANPLTAALGASNWALYTLFYTPMKRMTILNTWVGSIVGAIPPMMGWAAVTGGLEPGAWLMGALLYAWQFPHFNALSWNLRPDYSRGGYRMMSVINPELCKRVAMRYCVGMIGLSLLAPIMELTTWTFAFDSLPLNGYFAYLGWRFYRDGDSNSSRKLFRFSLIHIPVLLVLMLLSKNYKEKVNRPVSESILNLLTSNDKENINYFSLHKISE